MRTRFLFSLLVLAFALALTPGCGHLPGSGSPAGSALSAVPGAGGGSTGDAGADIKLFLSDAKMAEELMQGSVDNLIHVVATSKETKKLDDELKAANAIADPKEKKAKVREAYQHRTEFAQSKIDSDEKRTKLSNLDSKKKKALGNALFNLALVGLKDKDLVSRGQGLVGSVSSNPVNAAKMALQIGDMKDAISSLGTQAENIGSLTTQVVSLAKVNKVEPAMPKSSSEQAQKVSFTTKAKK